MEKSKSKKKLIGIIAGCAVAFILTVVVSVAVTLAYFGQTKTANDATITMGQALEFNGDIAAKVGGQAKLESALPGDNANITVEGSIKASTTKAYFLVNLAIAGDTTNTTEANNELTIPSINSATCTIGGTTKTLNVSGNYLYVSAEDGKCEELTISTDQAFVVTVSYTIPTTATNVSAGAKITVKATASIIQSQNIDSAIATVIAALDSVQAA